MDDRDAWFKKFKALAEYVAENEPTTLAYEAAVAEDDPLEVLAYERYAIHHASQADTIGNRWLIPAMCLLYARNFAYVPAPAMQYLEVRWSSCRYVDKDALHEIHERSTPYLQLKDDIKSAGIEYTSVISQSYHEQDLGFMETKF